MKYEQYVADSANMYPPGTKYPLMSADFKPDWDLKLIEGVKFGVYRDDGSLIED